MQIVWCNPSLHKPSVPRLMWRDVIYTLDMRSTMCNLFFKIFYWYLVAMTLYDKFVNET